MRKVLVLVLFSLIASSAFAGTITSLSPSKVKVNSGEYFLTVFGTAPGNRLIFDGPAGHFERDVTATFVDSVVGWVPEAIIQKSGVYAVKVRNAQGVETNSLNFTVEGFKFFPLAILVPDVLFVQPKSRDGGYVKWEVFVVGGEDPNPQWRCDQESGAFFKMGNTLVTCDAWNSFDERVSAKFTVTVADRVGPVVTVPDDIRVEARSFEGEIVHFDAKANDEIWGEAEVTCAPASGSMFRIGKTVVSCTAVDLDLNVGEGAFIVDVVGEKEPGTLELILPNPIQVEARDARGAEVSYEIKVKGTKDPDPIVNCSPKSGSLFPLGTTIVNCDVLDHEGAWAQGTFDVSVLDVKAPSVESIKPSPDRIVADGRMWPVTIDLEVSDDLDLQPACSIIGVTANEPIDAGDDDKEGSGDYEILDDEKLTVLLRGELIRSRVYNVWVGCSDFFGNMTHAYAQVLVTSAAGASQGTTSKPRRRSGGK
ncbi:MAG TPA: hypothetical protein VFV49_11450 [Thermoanaerobaculia bacterium]|nr:hypothetical protein [Thermoanaerobaculia bacterium]